MTDEKRPLIDTAVLSRSNAKSRNLSTSSDFAPQVATDIATPREIYAEWFRMYRMFGTAIDKSDISPYALGITNHSVSSLIAKAKQSTLDVGLEFTGWLDDQRRGAFCGRVWYLMRYDPCYRGEIPF